MTLMRCMPGTTGRRRLDGLGLMALCASAFAPGASRADRDQAASRIHSAVSTGAALGLNKARPAIVLFAGADALWTKVREDALTVELMGVSIQSCIAFKGGSLDSAEAR